MGVLWLWNTNRSIQCKDACLYGIRGRVIGQNLEFLLPNVDVPNIDFTKIDIPNIDITNTVPTNVEPPNAEHRNRYPELCDWLNSNEKIFGDEW